MSGVQLTAAALRILAIWIAATVVMNVPAFLGSWFAPASAPFGPGEMAGAWRSAVAQFGSASLVAMALWQGSDWLSRRIWTTAADAPLVALDAAHLQRAVFAGVGILLVTNGVPDLAEIVVAAVQLPDGFVQNEQMLSSRSARLAGIAVQVALGAWLVVGAAGLTRAVDTLRGADG